MAADGKIEALRSVSLFTDLRQRELEQVAQLVDEVDLPAGQVLMREGESATQMFMMASGEALVERGGLEVARLGPGSHVGEMAIVAEGPRTATVTLTEPAHLFVLAHREFHSLMDDVPAVRDCVMNEVARRLRQLETEKAH
jgi:CRP-like cAMP-binding protein